MKTTSINAALTLSVLALLSPQSAFSQTVEERALVPEVAFAIEEETSGHYEVDRKKIEQARPRNIQEALTLIPGFFTGASLGSIMVNGHLGLANESVSRALIMLNGVPVNVPSFGSVYWEALPITIDDVERIRYFPPGSTDSLGRTYLDGIIKIFTFVPGVSEDKIKAEVGNKSHKSMHISKSVIKNSTVARASAHYTAGDGVHTGTSDSLEKGVFVQLTSPISDETFLELSAGAGEQLADHETSPDEKAYAAYRKRDTRTVYVNAKVSSLSQTSPYFILGINQVDLHHSNELQSIPNFWFPGPATVTPVYDASYSSHRIFAELGKKSLLSSGKGTVGFYFNYQHDGQEPNHWSTEDAAWPEDKWGGAVKASYYFDRHNFASASLQKQWHSRIGWSDLDYQVSFVHRLSMHDSFRVSCSRASRYPNSWEYLSESHLYLKENPDVTFARHDNRHEDNKVLETSQTCALSYQYAKNKLMAQAEAFSMNAKNIAAFEFQAVPMGTGAYPDPVTGTPLSADLRARHQDKIGLKGVNLKLGNEFGKLGVDIAGSVVLSVDSPSTNIVDRRKTVPTSVWSGMVNYQLNSRANLSIRHTYVDGFWWESASSIDESKKLNSQNVTTLSIGVGGVVKPKDRVTLSLHNLQKNKSFFNDQQDDVLLRLAYETVL